MTIEEAEEAALATLKAEALAGQAYQQARIANKRAWDILIDLCSQSDDPEHFNRIVSSVLSK